jgi:hypothetical protein
MFFFCFFSNCKLNDSIVTDLKKKLNVAENKLTDIRLEALSSVHQVDQLKDYLDKMKVRKSLFSNITRTRMYLN